MPENRYRLWLSFLMGSGTLFELAGWLHQAEEDPRRELLRHVLPLANPGGPVELPGFDFAQEDRRPPVEWRTESSDRRPMVALTNWNAHEMRRTLGETPRGRGWMDMLTGDTFEDEAEIPVAPEDGRLLIAR